MSLSGISSSNLFNYENQSVQNKMQQFQQEFQQLGQDLQSGNLSAAQTDFTTLQQIGSNSTATSPTASSNPLAQAFNQLGQDLQSGNLSAAQQDFTNIQQDLQSQATQAHGRHHHHHGGGGGDQSNPSASYFSSWDRRCNPAACRVRSKSIPPCSRTSHRWVRAGRRPNRHRGLPRRESRSARKGDSKPPPTVTRRNCMAARVRCCRHAILVCPRQ